MAKVIEMGAVKDQQESRKKDWHGEKLSQAEMDNMSWDDREKIIDRTIITIPIATPQMWADFSGVPAEVFMRWKYKIDMEKYGRVLKSNMGHNI